MSKNKTIEETFALIDELTEIFIKEDGFVTCEFSTSGAKVEAIKKYIEPINERIKTIPVISKAEWCIGYCETCKEYSADHPYHVQLVIFDDKTET